MVSAFQDGDPNVGHGKGYGPSHHQGDLQGVINSLDYIKDLGFNAIWMTPIFASEIGDLHYASTGYAPTNYFKIDDRFGGNEKFKELVAKAHEKGIYIILDGVFGHHEVPVVKSPNGNIVYDKENVEGHKVKYPDSKPFFQEVATYWIEQYEIDGWRLDVAKELTADQDGNYLYDIREAVETTCDRRRAEGKKWGILGYIVAEYWDSIGPINEYVYTTGEKPACRSAFDFPFRSNLVKSLAIDEYGNKNEGNDYIIREIKDIHRTPKDKTYNRNDVYPNLFIDNHDTYRLGNLLRIRYGNEMNVDNDLYWQYHKLAIGILAVYTGPITILYGDEIGAITDCWKKEGEADCPTPDDDHYRVGEMESARIDGKIELFTQKEANLHVYTRNLLRARASHPSMWRGTYGKTQQGNVYFNCKYDPETGDKTVFVANFGDATTVNYEVGGVKLYDFATGEVIYSYENGKYRIPLDKLGTRVFQVYAEDTPITVTNVVGDCAMAEEAYKSSQNAANNKKVVVVIAIAAVVVVVVIVIAIVVVVHMKRKFTRELQEAKSNPLVDMSLE